MMDIENVEQLIRLAKESAISELTLRHNGVAVSIKKAAESVQVVPVKSAHPSTKKHEVSQVAPEPLEPEKGSFIEAPMVGIFHTADGAVAAGTKVRLGQCIGMIESMRLMNEITAPSDGVLEEVLAEDGMPVEYGQALFRLVSDL